MPAAPVGPNLYQTCIVLPQGTPIPLTVEYKFKKDDCQTWESVGNRSFVIDNALPAELILTSNWDDNTAGSCAPVVTETRTWSTVKALYE